MERKEKLYGTLFKNAKSALFIPCYSINLTINFNLTQIVKGVSRISSRVGAMSSVVVVNDISPVHNACYTDRVGYCGSGIFVVLETQSPVISVGGVRYID